MTTHTRHSPYSTIILLTLLPGLTSCGKSSFNPVNTQNQVDAPGSYTIPAKIDILLAVDDTGSALNAKIQAPLAAFMSNLNAQNWDFRVAATPLSQVVNISQVAVSKYDVRSRPYVQPYPGAIATGSTLAVSPGQLILPGASVSGGGEPGINTVVQTLEQEALSLNGGKRFLREDALTIIIIVSTSDDTSEGPVTYATGASPRPLNRDFITRIQTAKGYSSPGASKVYAFVNASTSPFGPYATTASCLGTGNSFSGNRYMQLAIATGGKSYDICSTPLTDIFRDLNTSLNIERKSYESEYVFIDQVPELSTVVIERVNEDGTKTIIPRASASNDGGWTYLEGYQNNLPSISYPIKMNYRSGYAFRLSKKYVLRGNQKANITFQARGLQNSP